MVSDAVLVAFGTPTLVPVIVIGAVVRDAFPDALILRVELVPVTDAGLKLPVTPDWSPVTVSATAPVKPPLRVIVTV